MIMPKQKGSKVLIYFHNYEISKQYCVDIEVKKAFEVRDAKDAGVKVYDFNEKRKINLNRLKYNLQKIFSFILQKMSL